MEDARTKGKSDDWLGPEVAPRPAPEIPKRISEPKAGPVIFTATTLLAKNLPEMKWAVNGLLPEGAIILAGRPKAGKSWLTMQLAITIACGGKFLGQTPTQMGEVLYLSLEDGERRLKSRFKKQLGAEQSHEAMKRIYLACDWPRHSKGGIEALDAFAKQHPHLRMVAIDTLARVRDKRNGTTGLYEEDYDSIARVKDVGDKYGVTMLIAAHTRKAPAENPQDEVSGTLGLTGAADAVLVLKRPAHGFEAKLHVSRRDVEEQELHLLFDKENCLWGLSDLPDDPLGPDRQAVLGLLKTAMHPMTCPELSGLLKRTTESTAKLLQRMVHESLLKKAGHGKYEPVATTPFDK